MSVVVFVCQCEAETELLVLYLVSLSRSWFEHGPEMRRLFVCSKVLGKSQGDCRGCASTSDCMQARVRPELITRAKQTWLTVFYYSGIMMQKLAYWTSIIYFLEAPIQFFRFPYFLSNFPATHGNWENEHKMYRKQGTSAFQPTNSQTSASQKRGWMIEKTDISTKMSSLESNQTLRRMFLLKCQSLASE